MTRLMFVREVDATEDVGVEHGIWCYMDGLPSRSSGVFRPAFVLAHYGAAPSSAQGPLSLAPERRMVEARGVEPLSGTPSTQASTRLADHLVFR